MLLMQQDGLWMDEHVDLTFDWQILQLKNTYKMSHARQCSSATPAFFFLWQETSQRQQQQKRRQLRDELIGWQRRERIQIVPCGCLHSEALVALQIRRSRL